MTEEQLILTKFGRVIAQLRRRKGLTQEALAHEADMNRSYIGDIERGNRNISLRNMLRLAAALNVELAELIRLAQLNLTNLRKR